MYVWVNLQTGILCLSDECRTSTEWIRLWYSLCDAMRTVLCSCQCVGIGFRYHSHSIYAIVIGTIHIALKSVSRWHNGPWHSQQMAALPHNFDDIASSIQIVRLLRRYNRCRCVYIIFQKTLHCLRFTRASCNS